jgi:hypothetical protein
LLLSFHLVQINNSTSTSFKSQNKDRIEEGRIWKKNKEVSHVKLHNRHSFIFGFYSSKEDYKNAHLWLSAQRLMDLCLTLIPGRIFVCRREEHGREEGLRWLQYEKKRNDSEKSYQALELEMEPKTSYWRETDVGTWTKVSCQTKRLSNAGVNSGRAQMGMTMVPV